MSIVKKFLGFFKDEEPKKDEMPQFQRTLIELSKVPGLEISGPGIHIKGPELKKIVNELLYGGKIMMNDELLKETDKSKNNIGGCVSSDCMNKKFYIETDDWNDAGIGDKITINCNQYIVLGKGRDNRGCFVDVRSVVQSVLDW